MKKKSRGEMRWTREKPYLALHWKDNKVDTMLSTIHNANDYVLVNRKVKVQEKWLKDLGRKKKLALFWRNVIFISAMKQFPARRSAKVC